MASYRFELWCGDVSLGYATAFARAGVPKIMKSMSRGGAKEHVIKATSRVKASKALR